MLPSQIRDDLETDPEQLALVCAPLLRYAQAKGVFDRQNEHEMKGWQGSEIMAEVVANSVGDLDSVQAELDAMEVGPDGWPLAPGARAQEPA